MPNTEGVALLVAGEHSFDSIAWRRITQVVLDAGLEWDQSGAEDKLVLEEDWELVLRKKKRTSDESR